MTGAPRPLEWDAETLIRFWSYHSQTPENYFSYSKSADVVRRSKRYLIAPMAVLDYGCGPGYLLPHLLKTGCDVWGGEISDDVVGAPGRSIPDMPTFHGIHTIDSLIGKQKFDAITFLEVIEHLDDASLDLSMKNMDQLLAKNGLLIITTPNDENLADNTVYCPASNTTFHRWQHMRSWSKASLTAFLEARGYQIERAEAVNFRDGKDQSSLPRKIVRRLIESGRKPHGLFVIARKES